MRVWAEGVLYAKVDCKRDLNFESEVTMSELSLQLPSAEQVRSLHNLEGQVALITGAGSGLGRAMAWSLACHGARIVIVDQDAAKAAECAKEIASDAGVETLSLVANVADETQVREAAQVTLARFGQLDILLNNAGHNIRKPVIEFTLEEFDSLHNVHLRGTFLFCRAFGKSMQARRSGSIINVGSILGQIAAPGVAPYGAAKAAIAAFGRVLALEMAPFNVRVNTLAPGYIDTPLTRQHAPEVRNRITSLTPLGRFGEAQELMGPLLFLASQASSFVTGSTLVVDGGWTAQ